MKKLLLLSLLFLMGCQTQLTGKKQFYVKSEINGYYVTIDSENGDTAVFISGPIHDPLDAKIVVEKLNRDMEGNWEK